MTADEYATKVAEILRRWIDGLATDHETISALVLLTPREWLGLPL